MTQRKKRRRARSAKQRANDSSARRGGILRLARLKALADRHQAPKCRAKRRDGQRCSNLATDGKLVCHRHGSATPSGNQWHVVQIPADPVKRARKLRDIARRRARQAELVAAMSPERLAQYRRRQLVMKPGGKLGRVMAKHDRAFREILSAARVELPEDPAVAALSARIADCERRATELRADDPVKPKEE